MTDYEICGCLLQLGMVGITCAALTSMVRFHRSKMLPDEHGPEPMVDVGAGARFVTHLVIFGLMLTCCIGFSLFIGTPGQEAMMWTTTLIIGMWVTAYAAYDASLAKNRPSYSGSDNVWDSILFSVTYGGLLFAFYKSAILVSAYI